MDYVKPADVVGSMLEAGRKKLALAPRDLLIRAILSGSLLGFATSLAYTGAISTSLSLVAALIFPVGLIIIILLGLELATGSFGLLPLMVAERDTTKRAVLINWSWVFLGNLIGSAFYGALLTVTMTMAGTAEPSALGEHLVGVAEAKTIAYEAAGAAGLLTVFVKAVLCNWMVCLAVVLAMTSTSTIGKIASVWMPTFIFFAQGFEHSVVNMFVIPTGMMLGADVSFGDWWLWNQIPVTLGNIVGGAIFCCGALYLTYRPHSKPTVVDQIKISAGVGSQRKPAVATVRTKDRRGLTPTGA